MVEQYEKLGEQIAQLILDHPGVANVCNEVASERAGTKHWTSEQWEGMEDTPQYDLYWATYAGTQIKIVVHALGKIANVQVP